MAVQPWKCLFLHKLIGPTIKGSYRRGEKNMAVKLRGRPKKAAKRNPTKLHSTNIVENSRLVVKGDFVRKCLR